VFDEESEGVRGGLNGNNERLGEGKGRGDDGTYTLAFPQDKDEYPVC
jgi:hypothetical protein